MTPLRTQYGGSDRPHHLALNRDVTRATTSASRIAAGGVLLLGIWQGWGIIDTFISVLSALILAPIACRTQELWASPDNDEAENWKRRHPFSARYWWLYGVLVHHRSVWSHSVLGTATRCLYGYWPGLLLLWLPSSVWMPIMGAWLVGCIASDAAHYALDIGPRLTWRQVFLIG